MAKNTRASTGASMEELYEAYSRRSRQTEKLWREDLHYEKLKKAGVGNIFIKNLEMDIREQDLSDAFTPFGKIARLKIARDTKGNSKGFAFVNFETEDAANRAINAMNGKLLGRKALYVAHFIRYNERH